MIFYLIVVPHTITYYKLLDIFKLSKLKHFLFHILALFQFVIVFGKILTVLM